MINKLYATMFIKLAKKLSAMSTNTIDDVLVAALEKALSNVDYGLQRKPIGPRPKAKKNGAK